MIEKWDDCSRVVCIQKYENLKPGYHYDIKGRGSLEFNNDPLVGDRKGYGFCIEDNIIRYQFYYFTIDEMNKYFITEEEDYISHKRNSAINQILNIN